ncbi:MAG: polysaccharide pyruvyl transferase family protein [Erythrobacter sp.]
MIKSLRNLRDLYFSKSISEPILYPRVDIYFWRPAIGLNFGDYLASVVVQRMLAEAELVPDEPTSRARRLLSVGSILHFAKNGDAVWGSGRNGKIPDERHNFARLDVRAVRGPKTRAFLEARGIKVPEVYGDPALLLPRLLPTRFAKAPVKGRIGLILNLNDPLPEAGIENAFVIDPKDHWANVIAKILSCEFLISGSLHGLVIADAYGVPCSFLRLSNIEPDFKYHDYFEGVSRTEYWANSSFSQALDRGPLPTIHYDGQALYDAFPYDLWTS